jgi:hypothetical protein
MIGRISVERALLWYFIIYHRGESSRVQVISRKTNIFLTCPGFKPPLRRSFFRHHSFGSKPGAKIKWKLTWHCCICCNPAKREGGI